MNLQNIMTALLQRIVKDKKTFVALCLLIVVGLSLKFIILFNDFQVLHKINFYLHDDSGTYLSVSKNLDTLSFDKPIGYSFFLSMLWTICGGVRPWFAVITQSLLALLVPISIFLILCKIIRLNIYCAFCIALATCLSPLNVILEKYFLADSLSLTVTALVLLPFFFFLERPTRTLAVMSGVALFLAPLIRSCWLFLGPVCITLFLFYHLFVKRQFDRSIRVIGTLFIVAYFSTYYAYGLFYSHKKTDTYAYFNQGPTFYSGWVMWSQYCTLAEAGDLDKYEWGKILLADMKSLHNGPEYQLWNGASTMQKLYTTYVPSNFKGSKDLLQRSRFPFSNIILNKAATHVIILHPINFIKLSFTKLMAYVNPVSRETLTQRRFYDKNWMVGNFMLSECKLDVSRTSAFGKFSEDKIHALYLQWCATRQYFLLFLLLGLIYGLVTYRHNFPCLAITSLGVIYYGIVCLTAAPYDRYFQPVEYFGLISLGCLLNGVIRCARKLLGKDGVASNESLAPAPLSEVESASAPRA